MCSNHKFHWKRWVALCVSKNDSGLSFKDFQSFNMVMLGKKWWKAVSNPNSLNVTIFQACYFSKPILGMWLLVWVLLFSEKVSEVKTVAIMGHLMSW